MAMPPYQPPGGPPPSGYYGSGPMEHPQGTTILVLGILSLVVCGVLGPVAWTMGNNALQEIDGNPYAYTNRSMVVAGRICGIVATVLLIISVAVLLIVLVAAATASSS